MLSQVIKSMCNNSNPSCRQTKAIPNILSFSSFLVCKPLCSFFLFICFINCALTTSVSYYSDTQINTYIPGDQGYPAVAVAPSGTFMITWASNGQDGDGPGIYAQAFDNTGTFYGSEFRVNTVTASEQNYP